jgi:hypothetical protein
LSDQPLITNRSLQPLLADWALLAGSALLTCSALLPLLPLFADRTLCTGWHLNAFCKLLTVISLDIEFDERLIIATAI